MLRYYVLCCRNMNALKRHFRIIPNDQLTVVINTLNSSFQADAIAYCQSEGVEYVVTESNGTASQGKNSVIDLFLESSYDHFVLVDGDDYLTPHGVWTYKYISEMDSPPDVIALEYQYGIWKENGYGFTYYENLITDPKILSNPYIGCTDRNNPKTVMGHGTRVFLQPKKWWDKAKEGKLIYVPPGPEGFNQRLNNTHKRWANLAYKYISNWETHHRIVFCSRRACDGFRYNTNYHVGEDTILYLEYKDAHLRGNLVLKHHYERYPTYVYDTRVDGVVFENRYKHNIKDLGWCEWLEALSEKFELMESEGLLYENTTLPRINDMITWPEGYTPDTLNSVNYPGPRNIIYP